MVKMMDIGVIFCQTSVLWTLFERLFRVFLLNWAPFSSVFSTFYISYGSCMFSVQKIMCHVKFDTHVNRNCWISLGGWLKKLDLVA